MSLLQALILGLIQGLTEFLPVSSDGHLSLIPFIAGWEKPSLAFIVATHIGTLLALLWVFRSRIAELIAALTGRGGRERDRSLLRLLVIGTVPAAIVGAVLTSRIESVFERPVAVSFLLGLNGWFLLTAESHLEMRETEPRDEDAVDTTDAVTIGIAQTTALLPGISRSGTTISAGMLRGLSREAAMQFSFLLAVPIIIGAIVVEIPDIAREGTSGSGGAMAVGIVGAAITGVFALRAMLGLVARKGLRPFGVYCFFAMTAGLLTALARG